MRLARVMREHAIHVPLRYDLRAVNQDSDGNDLH
jgi:hypothetical protein